MLDIINREKELSKVDEALKDLTEDVRLVQTPILGFYGVKGIGKSRLLAEVVKRCQQYQQVYCLKIQAQRDLPKFSDAVLDQIRSYLHKDVPQPASLEDSIQVTEDLLSEQRLLVMTVDAIDNTDEQQVSDLEKFLSTLVEHNTIFIVLASQREISFERQRNVALKMHPYPVEPLDREHSKAYLSTLSSSLSTEEQELILQWTGGYPLAMIEMVHAFQGGLPLNREPIMERVFERVIVEELLATVDDKEVSWFRTILCLLAVPRRFNLMLMQILIEKFEPDHRLSSSLAYMAWPRKITKATGVLHWDVERAGFTIEEPIRTILLLPLKIGNTQRYRAINQFLAKINWENAIESQDFDRVQYEKEAFYHRLVTATTSAEKSEIVKETMLLIVKNAKEQPDQLILFEEELLKDHELQKELNSYLLPVLDQLYWAIADDLHLAYQRETDQEKRMDTLYNMLHYVACISDSENARAIIKERVALLLRQTDPTWLLNIYKQLGQDKQFVTVMGDEYDILEGEIRNPEPREE